MIVILPLKAVEQNSALDIFGEHFFGVDGNEDSAAAGEHFIFVVEDFGGVDVGASLNFYFAAFDAQRLVKRNGLEIFDSHLASQSDHMMELVYFSHGFVEDGGDDATVAMAGWSGVALAEAEFADESLALFVENEFEAHAVFVIGAADEAVVLLHFVVASVVAVGLGLAWHGSDSNVNFVASY
jgi:hypothetical protein